VHLPRITKWLLFILTGAFLLELLFPVQSVLLFALWPLGEHVVGSDAGLPVTTGFYPWQLLTYAFLHDTNNFTHLFFNGIALFQFGAVLEQTWGEKKYIQYLLVCTIGAGLIQLLLVSSGVLGGIYPTLGASGGIFGLLLAYGMLFPNQQMMLIIPPIPMKARTMVIIFGAISLLLGVTGTAAGIAHFAHLGGMLFGWLMIRYWRGQPPFRKRGPRLVK